MDFLKCSVISNDLCFLRMQRAHPEEYNFVPQTWVLPAEYPLKIILKLFS